MVTVNPARHWARVIALQLIGTFTSSCAPNAAPTTDFAQPQRNETVSIVMKEWYVLPDKRTVEAGNIVFKVANQGRMDHEFIVMKTSLPLDALPLNEEGLHEKKAGKLIGEIEDIRPGESGEIGLNLTPGSYVLFCNRVEREGQEIVSHYRKGMRVLFCLRSARA